MTKPPIRPRPRTDPGRCGRHSPGERVALAVSICERRGVGGKEELHGHENIAAETGAAVGGTLYPGALSGPDGPAPTYLDMMRHNAMTLAQAPTS